MTAIKWQIEEMEQTEKAEKLGQENGSGVETRNWDKRTEEVKHKQGSFEDKGKEEAVEKRKRPLTEEGNEAQKQQHEEVGGSRASGEPLGKKPAQPPKKAMLAMRGIKHVRASQNLESVQAMQWTRHQRAQHNRRRSECKQCCGASICEHIRRRSQCKQCGESGICEHIREGYYCKQCSGLGICEHIRERYYCKQCSGLGTCEHNRQRRSCRNAGRRQTSLNRTEEVQLPLVRICKTWLRQGLFARILRYTHSCIDIKVA